MTFVKGRPEPVCVVPAVVQHPPRLGEIVQQRCRTGVIADLASGHEEAERSSVGIGDGVKLGVHASFGAIDEPPETPFFTRRLDAVRFAFRWVASIMIVFGVALAAPNPSIMRRKTASHPTASSGGRASCVGRTPLVHRTSATHSD